MIVNLLPVMSWQERILTGDLVAVSQPDWCADISMLLLDRESPLRMWFTEAMI